jgi:hypothetical protein
VAGTVEIDETCTAVEILVFAAAKAGATRS